MLKLKLQDFGHLMRRTDSLEKTLILEKIEGRRRRGWQYEMIGWHHQLDGHEFEQALGAGDGQGSLACCSLWGCRVGNNWATKLNWIPVIQTLYIRCCVTNKVLLRKQKIFYWEIWILNNCRTINSFFHLLFTYYTPESSNVMGSLDDPHLISIYT